MVPHAEGNRRLALAFRYRVDAGTESFGRHTCCGDSYRKRDLPECGELKPELRHGEEEEVNKQKRRNSAAQFNKHGGDCADDFVPVDSPDHHDHTEGKCHQHSRKRDLQRSEKTFSEETPGRSPRENGPVFCIQLAIFIEQADDDVDEPCDAYERQDSPDRNIAFCFGTGGFVEIITDSNIFIIHLRILTFRSIRLPT